MTAIERVADKLVLKSGSTRLSLDRSSGKAVMERKLLFWSRKPVERRLDEISDVTVDVGVDRASGVEICNVMLISRSGEGLALPASDKRDAETTAGAMREFLGLRSH
jgi:hypothetical protein